MMKNIYMVQACDTHGAGNSESAYLPYATGLLIANAFRHEIIKKHYTFKRFIYKKEDIDAVIDSMDAPAVVGFSTYIWNTAYNLTFAEKLKAAYPDCLIIFGGHNVYDNSSEQLTRYPFIDLLIHGEGEIPFADILLHYCTDGDFSDISNISYRGGDGRPVKTKTELNLSLDYPSPYLEGYFDDILKDDHITFTAIMETNRGCPYHCAYCDWGSAKQKIRFFPLERAVAEMEWFSAHKIQYCYCTDSNFGMFKRDYEIVDAFLEIKKRTGFPEKLHHNSTNSSGIDEFNINKKLNDCGLLKGAAIAMQSLSPQALADAGRKSDKSFEKYSQLVSLYNTSDIPTYCEFIYGLPGETYDSFAENMCRLLGYGGTKSCFIHYCELLINSALGTPENIDKFQIKTAKIPYTQFHCSPHTRIPEYSDIIISTYSMDYESWQKTVTLGLILQSCHFIGLTDRIALFLYEHEGIPYRVFYEGLIRFASRTPGTVLGDYYAFLKKSLGGYDRGEPITRVFYDPFFGDIEYPLEEGLCLTVMRDPQRFYEELNAYTASYIQDDALCRDLMKYQSFVLRGMNDHEKEERFSYDFRAYFKALEEGVSAELIRRDTLCRCINRYGSLSPVEYAREIIWYGRKSNRLSYAENEISTIG